MFNQCTLLKLTEIIHKNHTSIFHHTAVIKFLNSIEEINKLVRISIKFSQMFCFTYVKYRKIYI